jgi:hypothetical protein
MALRLAPRLPWEQWRPRLPALSQVSPTLDLATRTRVPDSRVFPGSITIVLAGVRGAWPEGQTVTRDRARKKTIRARMAARGESYSVAARKLGGSQPAAVRDVIARADRTLAAPSARIEYRVDREFVRSQQLARRRPGAVFRLVRLAAKAAWQRISPEMDFAEAREQFMHHVSEGFIEPAAGRYQIDAGHYATVYVDGQEYGGLSGQPLGPRYRHRHEHPDDPLRLLRLLQAATGAWPAGDEPLRGTPCRKLAVRADATELTVWIDDEYIRQIQIEEHASNEHSSTSATRMTELWDFGVPVGSLDWSRLPTFRTPG